MSSPLTPSSVLLVLGKLLRLLEKGGVDWDDIRHPIDSMTARRNLAEFLKLGCPRFRTGDEDEVASTVSVLLTSYDQGRRILGKDLILPAEISQARGLPYTNDQLGILSQTFPSENILVDLSHNNMVLVAPPPMLANVFSVRLLEPKLFLAKSGGCWYSLNMERRAFSEKERIPFGWLAIQKYPLPNLVNLPWVDQEAMIEKIGLRIPTVVEVAWVVTTVFKVLGVRILDRVCVRTSSVISEGKRAHVIFRHDGFYIDCWHDGAIDNLGVSAAWKF